MKIFDDKALLRLRAVCGGVATESIKLLLLAGLCEGALRLAASDYAHNLYDQEFTGGYPIQMQAPGYRGNPVPLAKAPGEYRILALGDSTTFGTGVAAEATWPAQLAALSQPSQRSMTYINAGVPAADIDQIRQAYEQTWSAYSPDEVVLAISSNMVSWAWIRREQVPAPPDNPYLDASQLSWQTQVKRAYSQFALPAWLSVNSQRSLYWLGLATHDVDPQAPYGPMLALGWKQANLPPDLVEAAWREFEADLKALQAAVAADGRRLTVVYVPPRFMVSESWLDNEKRVPKQNITIDPGDRLQQICQGLGLSYLDATPALIAARHERRQTQDHGDPMYVRFDYTHLDAAGHQAVAKALWTAEEIAKSQPSVTSRSDRPVQMAQ